MSISAGDVNRKASGVVKACHVDYVSGRLDIEACVAYDECGK